MQVVAATGTFIAPAAFQCAPTAEEFPKSLTGAQKVQKRNNRGHRENNSVGSIHHFSREFVSAPHSGQMPH
ncbi:MAG TPA: hypothetical protein VFE47_19775 [Tepidisphaeraceae bacterium]|nr:hypothetical protein [Tepidisphaeraceae bacterium]